MITVTGIDGCGKSSLLRNLQRCPEYRHFNFISCPRFHELGDQTLNKTSQILESLNSLSDRAKSDELKAVTVFLQLRLFQSYLDDSKINISERHPLFDSFVYGPLLTKSLGQNFPKPMINLVNDHLNRSFPGELSSFMNWANRQVKQSLASTSLFDCLNELKNLFILKEDLTIKKLSEVFQLSAPQLIIYLDIKPHYAVELIRKRDRNPEMHENIQGLSFLSKLYDQLIKTHNADWQVETISIEEGRNMEDVLKLSQIVVKNWISNKRLPTQTSYTLEGTAQLR